MYYSTVLSYTEMLLAGSNWKRKQDMSIVWLMLSLENLGWKVWITVFFRFLLLASISIGQLCVLILCWRRFQLHASIPVHCRGTSSFSNVSLQSKAADFAHLAVITNEFVLAQFDRFCVHYFGRNSVILFSHDVTTICYVWCFVILFMPKFYVKFYVSNVLIV